MDIYLNTALIQPRVKDKLQKHKLFLDHSIDKKIGVPALTIVFLTKLT